MGSRALDQAARQMGFRDYATYQAYQVQQQAMQQQPNPPTGAGAAPGAPPQNWLQHLLSSIPIHPSYLLGKVNDAFTKAGQ